VRVLNLRRGGKKFFCLFPFGVKPFEQIVKPAVVAFLEQVGKLVDYYILKAVGGLFGKLEAYPDSAGFYIAAAPAGFHVFYARFKRIFTIFLVISLTSLDI